MTQVCERRRMVACGQPGLQLPVICLHASVLEHHTVQPSVAATAYDIYADNN